MRFLYHVYYHNIISIKCSVVFSYEVTFTDIWGRRFLRYTVTSYFSNVVCASMSIDQHNESCDGYWYYYRSEYYCASSIKSLQYLTKMKQWSIYNIYTTMTQTSIHLIWTIMTQKYLKHSHNITLSKEMNNAPLGWYGTYTIKIAPSSRAPLGGTEVTAFLISPHNLRMFWKKQQAVATVWAFLGSNVRSELSILNVWTMILRLFSIQRLALDRQKL